MSRKKLAPLSGTRIIIGDHHTVPEDAPIAGILSKGTYVVPETHEEIDEPTRRGGTRHIDYMMVTTDLIITERQKKETTSDHSLICYELPWTDTVPTYAMPNRSKFAGREVTPGELA